MSFGAIDTPPAKDVASKSGLGTDTQAPFCHRIVQSDQLRVRRIGMGNNLHLHLSGPLNIIGDSLSRKMRVLEDTDGTDAGKNKVAKRRCSSIVGPDVPSQTVVRQSEGNHLPLGRPARRGHVGHQNRTPSCDGSGHRNSDTSAASSPPPSRTPAVACSHPPAAAAASPGRACHPAA